MRQRPFFRVPWSRVNDPRRFDESELALILRQAAELQARDSVRPHGGGGLSLPEIQAIAAEVGIEPGYVQRAAAGLAVRPPSQLSRIAGGPARIETERTVDGSVDADTLAAIADATRSEFGEHGTLRDALGGIEWRARGDWGTTYVTVRSGTHGTRVVVGADRSNTAWALGLIVPIIGVVVGAAAAGPIGVQEVIGAAGGAAAGLTGARYAWSHITARWRTRIDSVAERLREIASRT